MSGVPYVFGNATTSIPLSQLDVNFATNATIGTTSVGLGNTTTTLVGLTNVSTTVVNTSNVSANTSLLLQTNNGTTAVTIDTAQNMGLGVTPSAWSGVKAFQTGSGGVATTALWDLSNNTFLTNGAYWNGSNYIYVANSFPAARYVQTSGAHTWSTAAGGTAGNAISFTQAMTLDASGNLLVNVTSTVNSSKMFMGFSGGRGFGINDAVGGAGTQVVWFQSAGTQVGSITTTTSTTSYNITSDRRLKTNIVDFTDSGKYIDAFKPRSFTWITDNSQDIGFITDEYQETLPSAITGQPNETKEEEYEVTPAVKDEQGNITTPAVMGTRTVPVYQQGDFSTSAKMAIIIAELKSIRERLKTANIA